MPRNFLNIINAYAKSRGVDSINWEDLTAAFPPLTSKEEPTEGKAPVTISVHCECTVAVHIIQKSQNQTVCRRFVKIGASKHTCWFCQKYLEFLERDLTPKTKFIVSGYQGKIHAGWKPPAGPSSALGDIVRLLKQEVDEILGTVRRRRRSDSFPMASNPYDTKSFGWRECGGRSRLLNMFTQTGLVG
jgi:OTT_1508-like deaminase